MFGLLGDRKWKRRVRPRRAWFLSLIRGCIHSQWENVLIVRRVLPLPCAPRPEGPGSVVLHTTWMICAIVCVVSEQTWSCR